MSGSITFQHGPFKRWNLSLYGTWSDGRLARTQVTLSTPWPRTGRPLSATMQFTPGVDGFEYTAAAEMGGAVSMAVLLNWVIEASRAALDLRTDITPDLRRHWTAIIDEADHTRADFAASYPDGIVPMFEVVGRLSIDVRHLVNA
jgi:hypothetical protein